MKRVFIAIDISKEIDEKIRQIQNKLPEFMGKKTELKNLHLTLKFLGLVHEEKIEIVKEKLRSIKMKRFETVIDKMGFFDNRKSKKYERQLVVWLHMTGCDGLQKEIDEKLLGLFEKERRFMSHLTIARVKKVDDRKNFLEKLKKIKFGKMKFNVDKFIFKESNLTRKGPIYRTIEEYNLN